MNIRILPDELQLFQEDIPKTLPKLKILSELYEIRENQKELRWGVKPRFRGLKESRWKGKTT